MESKQIPSKPKDADTPVRTASDLAGKIADIELKLDHIIESIHDSLYRLKMRHRNDREESP